MLDQHSALVGSVAALRSLLPGLQRIVVQTTILFRALSAFAVQYSGTLPSWPFGFGALSCDAMLQDTLTLDFMPVLRYSFF